MPDNESAPAVGDGTTVRIALGEVRQATDAHAIAAKATAIQIAVSAGSRAGAGSDSRGHQGYGGASPVVAEMGIGLLEAAAVAPGSPGATTTSGVSGSGGGLPITGPQAGLIATGGAGLLIAGGAALVLTRRRRGSIN